MGRTTKGRRQRAFVLRLSADNIDRLVVALKHNQLIIGWGEAKGLIQRRNTRDRFYTIIGEAYPDYNSRRLGDVVGKMWRFVREMEEDDLVVVPSLQEVYFARVAGTPRYVSSPRPGFKSTYRRRATWLNGRLPLRRQGLPPGLRHTVRYPGTICDATDLLPTVKRGVARFRD